MANVGSKSSIGTTPVVALVGSETLVDYGVWIKAAAANSGKVYVGLANTVTADSTDATDGYQLSANAEVWIPKVAITDGDLQNIFLVASASSQKVFFLGY